MYFMGFCNDLSNVWLMQAFLKVLGPTYGRIQSVVGLLLVRSQSHGALFSEAGKSLQRKEKLIATDL